MLGGPANDPTLPSVLEPLETWLRARGLELHEMASPARCAAERIDGGQITAGDLASLVGALRTSLSELYRDAAVVNDPPPEPRLRGRALLVARHASPRTRRPL
jgi:hypothetical protein